MRPRGMIDRQRRPGTSDRTGRGQRPLPPFAGRTGLFERLRSPARSPSSHRLLVVALVFAALWQAAPVSAHNGAVAFAVPVDGITVDGDLSDWPDGLERYPVAWLGSGGSPQDAEDLEGSFRIGYSVEDNALYLAVSVRDGSTVIDPDIARAWERDGCEVYVDPDHQEKPRNIGQYYVRGDTPGVNDWRTDTTLDDVQAAVQRQAQVHRYEWRIDIGRKTGEQVHLRAGMTLGLDIALNDRDADGSYTWVSWGSLVNKFSTDRLGDVVLVEPDAPRGTLTGQVAGEDGEALERCRVYIRSLESDTLWVAAWSDQLGAFTAQLPAGRYRVAAGIRGSDPVEVEVPAGEETTMGAVIAPAPQGQMVEAGPGRRTLARGTTVPAGPGARRGSWRTLGVADGLSDPTVAAVLQDRDGYMWFGTLGGGVVRYDGEEMTRFSSTDGLGQGVVLAMLEDSAGNLWIGTGGGGLSCFDGRAFVTYTADDGLPVDGVTSLALDAEGNLWIGTHAGLCRYDGRTFTTYTSEDGLVNAQVRSLLVDRDGVVWIGGWFGLSRFDGRAFHSFTREDGLAVRSVEALLEDRQGRLWVAGGFYNGVSMYDGELFSHHDMLSGPDDGTWALGEDHHGDIWVGRQEGLSLFDGQRWTPYGAEDGLPDGAIGAIYQDRDRNMWFGTGFGRLGLWAGNGVTQYDGDAFVSYSMDAAVFGLARDGEGRIWLGTANGIRVLADGVIRTEIPQTYTADVIDDPLGRIWFSDARQNPPVYHVLESGSLGTYSLARKPVVSWWGDLFIDAGGAVWYSTKGVSVARIGRAPRSSRHRTVSLTAW